MIQAIEEKVLNAQSASNRAGAAIDVAERNDKYMQTYTAKETERAWDAYAKITEAYKFTDIYVNFRKDFIAIKITNAKVSAAIKVVKMESVFAAIGITKVITPQGIIYQIPKKATN